MMKKNQLFILLCLSAATFVAHAQHYEHPNINTQRLTIEEFLAGKTLGAPNNKILVNKTVERPTVMKQRMIASAFRQSSSAAPAVLSDSTRYTYTDFRGSYFDGTVNTISDFDTAYAYQSSDNFVVPVPKYAKRFDASNRTVSDVAYFADGDIQQDIKNDYFSNGQLRRNQVTNLSQLTNDRTYSSYEYNQAGAAVYDTSHSHSSNDTTFYGTDYHYDNTNRLSFSINRYYISGSSGYTGIRSTWYFYDGNNLKPSRDSVVASLIANGTTTPMLNITTNENEYNSSGSIIQKTMFSEPGHLAYRRMLTTYNSNGKRTSYLTQSYENGQWVNVSKSEYDYTQDINTLLVVYNWNTNSGWVEQTKSVSILNAAGLTDSMKNYFMGQAYNLYTYAYNSFNHLTQHHEYNLYGGNGTVTSFTEKQYYYEDYDDPTSTSALRLDETKFKVYPNPAYSSLHIKADVNFKNASYRITDISGRILKTSLIKDDKDAIEVSRLPDGLYFIEVLDQQNGILLKQKFIKI